MKCDGHATLTEPALQFLVSKCKRNSSLTQSLCNLPDFQAGKKVIHLKTKTIQFLMTIRHYSQ